MTTLKKYRKRRLNRSKSHGGGKPPKLRIFRLGYSDKGRYRKTSDVKMVSTLEKLEFSRFRCKIFLDTDDDEKGKEVFESVKELLDAIGYDIISEEPAFKGSWKKKFLARSRVFFSGQKRKRAFFSLINAVLTPNEFDGDKEIQGAASRFRKSLKDVPQGSIILGRLVLIKVTRGKEELFCSQLLSRKQLNILRIKPELEDDPELLISELGLKTYKEGQGFHEGDQRIEMA